MSCNGGFTCLIPVSYKCFTSPCFSVVSKNNLLGNKTSDLAQRLKVVKILAALAAELSILNSIGASPSATKKVAALVVAALVTALCVRYIL